jgi:CubicO group peptidase (beta-lactamase class C family)
VTSGAADPRSVLDRVRAPDVVVGVSRGGERSYHCGGTAAEPPVAREELAYALGSLSKTFTVLLLADLARAGAVRLDDTLASYLPDTPAGHARAITLRHLATHTSGLPRVPRDLVAGALAHPYRNGYAGYGPERLLLALATARVRHAPGTRWHYSNLGVALLGAALEHAARAPYAELLTRRVLVPLGLTGSTVGPRPGGPAATGRRADGRTALPPSDLAAFTPAGALVATPADVLTYAEALIDPPGPAQRDVLVPQLRRRTPGHRGEVHTLAWYQHPGPGGPLLFHSGATFGQQCFLGFHPASRTAVAAFATRHDRTCAVVGAGYALLRELAAEAAG